MKKIVICGNYGATNLGDEAILEGILEIIRNAIPDADITVLSSNPQETEKYHSVKSVYTFPSGIRSLLRGLLKNTISDTINAISETDLFILGGGGLFTDEKLFAVIIWSLQAKLAQIYRKPVFCLGQSVGPLKTFFGRRVAGNVFKNAIKTSVRDNSSLQLLTKMGVTDVIELADPAFMIRSQEPVPEKVEPFVVFSIRPWIKIDEERLYENLASFIIWLYKEHNVKSVLVPFQILKDNDLLCMNKIVERIDNILKTGPVASDTAKEVNSSDFVEIFQYSPDYMQVMELMSRSTCVVGMRLHSLIFASLASCPFIGLSYSQKVRQFVNQMNLDEYLLDVNEFELADLKSGFSAIMANRSSIIEDIVSRVIVLRSKAEQHGKILEEVLK